MSSSLDNSVNGQLPELRSLPEPRSMVDLTIPTIPSEEPSCVSLDHHDVPEIPCTPVRTRARCATILTRSPEAQKRPSLEIDTVTPNHKAKSRSQHDLGRPITPVTRLTFELEQRE